MKEKIKEYILLTNQIFSRVMDELSTLKAAADRCKPSDELIARSRKLASDLVEAGMIPADDETIVAEYLQDPERALIVMERVLKQATMPDLGRPAGKSAGHNESFHTIGDRSRRSPSYDLFIERLSAIQ